MIYFGFGWDLLEIIDKVRKIRLMLKLIKLFMDEEVLSINVQKICLMFLIK